MVYVGRLQMFEFSPNPRADADERIADALERMIELMELYCAANFGATQLSEYEEL